MWASLPLLDTQPSTSGGGAFTPIYNKISNAGEADQPGDPRGMIRVLQGTNPDKMQIHATGTIFVSAPVGSNILICRPNQARPCAINTAAGSNNETDND